QGTGGDPRRDEDIAPYPSLQSGIDEAVARSFLYRFLAQCYEDPTIEAWAAITGARFLRSLESAICNIAAKGGALENSAAKLRLFLNLETFDAFFDSYLAAFGHAARGRCPLNEIEYGNLKADPLFQPHRLADLGGFYRSFGLEIACDADERQDHI